MKTVSSYLLLATAVTFAALPLQAQILANAASDYRAGTLNSVMTPLADTYGTGTWAYDLAYVNSDTNPTSISGKESLSYINNTVNTPASGTPYYGTTASNSYNVLGLPSVSNSQIFQDSPAPAPGYLETHPGGDTAASVIEWTAGAGETGTLTLTFDLSRVNVNPPPTHGPVGSQGYLDFGIYENGTQIYQSNAMYIGSDTGVQTLTLTGVTVGTKLDFVTSATDGVLGFNLGYLSAQISEVPEPGTWALMLGGLGLLILVQRSRRKTALR